jgi:hypothetical protein
MCVPHPDPDHPVYAHHRDANPGLSEYMASRVGVTVEILSTYPSIFFNESLGCTSTDTTLHCVDLHSKNYQV